MFINHLLIFLDILHFLLKKTDHFSVKTRAFATCLCTCARSINLPISTHVHKSVFWAKFRLGALQQSQESLCTSPLSCASDINASSLKISRQINIHSQWWSKQNPDFNHFGLFLSLQPTVWEADKVMFIWRIDALSTNWFACGSAHTFIHPEMAGTNGVISGFMFFEIL